MCVDIEARAHRSKNVLQCVAVCCNVLQCGTEYKPYVCRYRGPRPQKHQRVAVCCSVLQCVAVCCSVLQCDTQRAHLMCVDIECV